GIIGKSFAWIFALNGYTIHIFDVDQSQLQKCIDSIKQDLKDIGEKCTDTIRQDLNVIVNDMYIEKIIGRVFAFTDLAKAVNNAFLIQECVPENLELKRKVYKEVDGLMTVKQILSSSTSSLLPSILSKDLKHKKRFIVCHPVNPVDIVPIVEIVPAPWTDLDVIKTMKDLLSGMGKQPIVLIKEVPGFIVNRLQYAILNESYNLVNRGIVSVQDVDKVMSEGLSLRWAFLGPFQIASLNANGWNDYCDKYSKMIKEVSDTFDPPQLYEGKTSDSIFQQLQAIIPIGKLNQAREKLANQMRTLL
ncbi:unnamed protein product, partial [Gordionus sp. m RMFG-2023]